MPLSAVLPLLPHRLHEEISFRLSSPPLSGKAPAEIRLRRGRIASLSVYRDGALYNLPLGFRATEADMSATLSRATGGSAYAHEEELKEGFFTLPCGVRIGVAGDTVTTGNTLSLHTVNAIVFRLPIPKCRADALTDFYEHSTGGILLFAPPGGGKTTALRALAAHAARSRRVAVIDTRRELFFPDSDLLLDRLAGYPKAIGAEIAVRTLSPELLILDEVGQAEAASLASLVSFGVRTVASVHGEQVEDVLFRPALRPLLSSGLFSHLWDVKRAVPVALAEARG